MSCRVAVIVVLVFALVGCGSSSRKSSATTDRRPVISDLVYGCLTGAGFSLRSLPTRVTGTTPSGATFVIRYFTSRKAATADAAAKGRNARAIESAVLVTRAKPKDVAVITRCITDAVRTGG
jgi:hypothetical protein